MFHSFATEQTGPAIVTRLTATRLTMSLWSVAALLNLAIACAGGASLATAVRIAITYGSGALLSLTAAWIFRRSSAHDTGISLTRILLVAVPCGTALFIIDGLGRAIEYGQSPIRAWPTALFLAVRPNWAYYTMLFVFQSTITWLIDAERALDRHRRLLFETRLLALRLQLNPHFLLNSLNALLSLIAAGRVADAEQMISRVSGFLQASMVDDAMTPVTLAAELDMADAYLGIETVRFGDRLTVRYTCAPSLSDAEVPHLILQPLIENAVKHAVARSKTPVTISIEAIADGSELCLIVRDDARPPTVVGRPTVVGDGLGLRNVATRLAALYGQAAAITVEQGEEGFAAIVRLPLSGVP